MGGTSIPAFSLHKPPIMIQYFQMMLSLWTCKLIHQIDIIFFFTLVICYALMFLPDNAALSGALHSDFLFTSTMNYDLITLVS